MYVNTSAQWKTQLTRTWQVYPFREQQGAQAAADVFWAPLMKSMTRMQRRQDIFIGGENEVTSGEIWVMSMGKHFVYPGPRNHDGLLFEDAAPEEGVATLALVNKMVDDLATSYLRTGY